MIQAIFYIQTRMYVQCSDRDCRFPITCSQSTAGYIEELLRSGTRNLAESGQFGGGPLSFPKRTRGGGGKANNTTAACSRARWSTQILGKQ